MILLLNNIKIRSISHRLLFNKRLNKFYLNRLFMTGTIPRLFLKDPITWDNINAKDRYLDIVFI